MFPFIWWLGEQGDPALPVDGGGGDFLRRGAIIAASQAKTGWSPERLYPTFWIAPFHTDLLLDGDADITAWRSRGSDPQAIAGVGSLPWFPRGWNARTGSPHFSQAAGGPYLSTATPPISTLGSGSDVPFSILCTLQADLIADHVICGWSDTTPGLSSSLFRINNAGGGNLRYTRTDSAAGSVSVDGTHDVGLGHQRVGLSFRGTTVDLFCGRDLDVSAACNVGSLTLNLFRIGTGPVINAFTGFMPEVVVVPRAISIAEWQAYYDGSRRRLGP